MKSCYNCETEFEPIRKSQKFCSKNCKSRFNIKQWRKNNPVKEAEQKRRYGLKKKYGISEQEYEVLFNSQHGRCAICRKTSVRKLDVDHNHETGKIRGLLCNLCNQAIGLLKEDQLIFKSAINYLNGGVS